MERISFFTVQGILKMCVLGLVAMEAAMALAGEAGKTNVLLIYIDDLRPELKCYGRSKLVSPKIDKLAGRALLFDNAYCQVPICMPSRVSTLSGKYAYGEQHGRLRTLLPAGLPSLPGHFKAHGYDTVSIGKVYHYNTDDQPSWTRRYTDTFYEARFVSNGYCSGYQLKVNQEALRVFRKVPRSRRPPLTECVDAPDSAYPDGVVADLAIAELKKHSDSKKPLFLGVGFYRPHLPWAAPKKYWDYYDRKTIDIAANPFFPKNGITRNYWSDLSQYGDKEVNAALNLSAAYDAESFPVLSEKKQRELVHGYRACVSFVDAQVGRVLDALDRQGMAKNTVVVLCSDNGWQLGEHKLWSKCSNYEEATRVVLMIAAPGQAAGKRTGALTELVDVYPTLCDLAGLPMPEHLEGISLAPLLKEPSRPWKKAVFSEWVESRTMRTDCYRLTRYNKAYEKGSRYQLPSQGRYELYDYETDPAGNENIAGDPANAELLNRLIAQMEAGWQGARPPLEQ